MREFDYVIIGGGCAGLSLAYELAINNKLKVSLNDSEIDSVIVEKPFYDPKKKIASF